MLRQPRPALKQSLTWSSAQDFLLSNLTKLVRSQKGLAFIENPLCTKFFCYGLTYIVHLILAITQ